MVSDSIRTIAAIIVVAIVLAAVTPIFVGRSDGISLRARDIGSGWQENVRNSNNTSYLSENIIFWEWTMLSNETSIIVAHLNVFESTVKIDEIYLFQDPWLTFRNAEEVDIGDLGYVYGCGPNACYGVAIGDQGYSANPANVAMLAFVQNDTLCEITVSVKGVDTPAQPWIWDFILDLGKVQSQKIDRFSSGS